MFHTLALHRHTTVVGSSMCEAHSDVFLPPAGGIRVVQSEVSKKGRSNFFMLSFLWVVSRLCWLTFPPGVF